LSVSSAAVLIRMTPAPASSIAFWRLFLTAIMLAPLLFKKRRHPVPVRQILPLALSGLFLALHFIFWIHSLSLLPVALSTALVSTHPLMLAVYSRLRQHRRLQTSTRWSLGLVVLGLCLLGLGDMRHIDWTGVGEALAGALFAGLYLLTGQHARQQLSASEYSTGTYAAASVLLAASELLRRGNLGPMNGHLLVLYLLMALIPTLGGHTLFNWLLRWVPASRLSLAMVGEIPGAALLAWLVLHQMPGWPIWLSITLITAGIGIALRTPAASISSAV
jgi:drug/metabolite transporter (DMT)-like permease